MSDYFESGFAVRKPSWHGKENLLTEAQRPQNWEEGRVQAGLTWDYLTEPMFRRVPEITAEGVSTRYDEVAGHKVITRTDTGAVLHTSRESYEVITIKEMGEIMHAVTDSTKLPMETMGSVRDGKSVWGLALLDEPKRIGTDPSLTQPYLGIVNHADGTGACRAYPTSIRIVCWNTLSAADAQADTENTVAVFRHTKSWRDRIEEARKAIFGARVAFDKYVGIAEELQRVTINEAQAETFVRTLIAMPPQDEFVSARVRANVEHARGQLRSVLHASITTEGIEGSAYWLVQGAAEYFDHLRPFRNEDSYVQRTVLGVNKAKGLATKFALEIAGEETLHKQLLNA
jgi:phage/plasmid-like protein (TIGR03299 family)